MRWLPWTRKPRRLEAAHEWRQAEHQQRAEYDAAVSRILGSEPSWNGPTRPLQVAPLLTRGQNARADRAGRR